MLIKPIVTIQRQYVKAHYIYSSSFFVIHIKTSSNCSKTKTMHNSMNVQRFIESYLLYFHFHNFACKYQSRKFVLQRVGMIRTSTLLQVLVLRGSVCIFTSRLLQIKSEKINVQIIQFKVQEKPIKLKILLHRNICYIVKLRFSNGELLTSKFYLVSLPISSDSK